MRKIKKIFAILISIYSQKFRQVSEYTCGIYSLKFCMYLLGKNDDVIKYFILNKHNFDSSIKALEIVNYLENSQIKYEAYKIKSEFFLTEFKKLSIVEGIIDNHYVTVVKCTKKKYSFLTHNLELSNQLKKP